MKQIKIFALALAATFSLAGCVKNSNAWGELEPVMPGMTIYAMATNQNYVAMEPANVGMRVAMLVSEALSQDGNYDLSKLSEVTTSSGKNVFAALFLANVNTNTNTWPRIEPVEGIGYRVTFPSGSQMPDGTVLEGTFTIQTSGYTSLASGGRWDVSCSDVTVKSNPASSQPQQIIHIEGGNTQISCDGAGKFSITVENLRSNFDNTSIYSDWRGFFTVTTPNNGQTFTYQLCGGKPFTVSGSGLGSSMYSGSAAGSSLSINYSVSDATYYGMQIVSGTQTCTLPNAAEYDTTNYPASSVTYRWMFNEASGRINYSISYNGTTVTI